MSHVDVSSPHMHSIPEYACDNHFESIHSLTGEGIHLGHINIGIAPCKNLGYCVFDAYLGHSPLVKTHG
jgi:hypothetical protein